MSSDDLGNGTAGDVTLADKFSVAWLGLLGAALATGLLGVAYLLVTGQITFDFSVTGTLPVARLYGTAELVFIGLTFLAFLEVFGKKKVVWLLDRVNVSIGGGDEE